MRMRMAAIACAVVGMSQLLIARVVELPALSEGCLPNSEVVTNVALGVELDRLRELSFSLALDASCSNSVSIAVGSAAGECLTLEEADFEWGYDCGKWFYADTATGMVNEWTAAETGRVERALTIRRSDFNPIWNCVRIVKRGLGDIHYDAVQTNDTRKFSISLR